MVCVISNYTALLMINEISGVKVTELRAFKLKVPEFAEDSGDYWKGVWNKWKIAQKRLGLQSNAFALPCSMALSSQDRLGLVLLP